MEIVDIVRFFTLSGESQYNNGSTDMLLYLFDMVLHPPIEVCSCFGIAESVSLVLKHEKV